MTRRDIISSASALMAGVQLSSLALAAGAAPAKSSVAKAAASATTASAAAANAASTTPKLAPRFGDGRDWFFEKRFGMFVHWGIYSVAGWHEQQMYRKKLSRAEYAPLMQKFNPVKFNPDAWLDLAAQAGMGYLTFTTKHVDGFCLWDTKQTDYNVTRTPYGKDTLAMLAEACHRRKFPLCLYYSCADMHQPNYPSAGRPYELRASEPGDQPDLARYLEFVKAQVRELCSNYGAIHGFWWDANVIKHRDPSFNALIRQLQPAAVINNRGFDNGDYGTPERDWDSSVNTKAWFDAPVEACQAVGYQSWGWRQDEDYYSDAHLISGIQKVLAKGGNYLLNVGPKPDGTIDEASAAILQRIGKWFGAVKESLLGVEPAGALSGNRDVVLTRRANTLYVHLVKEPETASIFLQPMTDKPRRATLLNTGEAVDFDVCDLPRLHNQTPDRCLRIKHLPVNDRPTAGWVLKLEFDHPPSLSASGKKQEDTDRTALHNPAP
ncbi:MAG: alpha-L-fucosidase [Candidatus Sumerlaeota bacterium]|nr:alpha-L-fucosidase [Candidatus Sumerlaeota bacterium]